MATQQLTPQQINNVVLHTLKTSPAIAVKTATIGTFTPDASGNVTAQAIRVGLLKAFLIRVKTQVNATAAVTLNPVGQYNLLSKLVYSDTSNTVRHSLSGVQLTEYTKRRYGAVPGNFAVDNVGNAATLNALNFSNPLTTFPASVAAAGNAPIEMWYRLPIAEDITGELNGIEAMAVTNNTASLTMTLNTGAVTDNLHSIASGAVTFTNTTVTVYQEYFGGSLPTDAAGNIIVPPLSGANKYRLISNSPNISVSQNARTMIALDQPYSYLGASLMFAVNGTAGPSSSAGGTPDLATIGFFSDAETPVYELPPSTRMLFNHAKSNSTFRGFYPYDFTTRPVNAQTAGLFYVAFTPAVAGAYTFRLLLETLGA